MVFSLIGVHFKQVTFVPAVGKGVSQHALLCQLGADVDHLEYGHEGGMGEHCAGL